LRCADPDAVEVSMIDRVDVIALRAGGCGTEENRA
jgi:hypothetical protein